MAAIVVPGIDRAWLAELARQDPVAHAWAVWDLERFPDRVDFVTLRESGSPTAYLLIWRGALPMHVVHWVGRPSDARPLLEALPRPPLLATVPLEYAESVAARVGVEPAVVQLRSLDTERAAPPEVEGRARPLGPNDLPALRAFAEAQSERIAVGYRTLDPVRDRVFGAFSDGRLVSAARVQVALPSVWVIGGVVTDPGYRNLGLATDITRLIVRRALAVGARPALYVLEANAVAVRLYDRIGFRVQERRGWIDAAEKGAGGA